MMHKARLDSDAHQCALEIGRMAQAYREAPPAPVLAYTGRAPESYRVALCSDTTTVETSVWGCAIESMGWQPHEGVRRVFRTGWCQDIRAADAAACEALAALLALVNARKAARS